MSRLSLLPVLLVALGAACVPQVEGAACRTTDQCPQAQVCSAACTCAFTEKGAVEECPGYWLRDTLTPSSTGSFGSAVLISSDGQRVVVAAPREGRTEYSDGNGAIFHFKRQNDAGYDWREKERFDRPYESEHFGTLLAGSRELGTVLVGGVNRVDFVFPDWRNGYSGYIASDRQGPRALTLAGVPDESPLGAVWAGGSVWLDRARYSGASRSYTAECDAGVGGVRLLLDGAGERMVFACRGEGTARAVVGSCSDGGFECGRALGDGFAFVGAPRAMAGTPATLVTLAPAGGVDTYNLASMVGSTTRSASGHLPVPGALESVVVDDSLARFVVTRPRDAGLPRVELWQRANGGFARAGVFRAPETAAEDSFGDAVAISADGHFILVGAPGAERAYVFGD